MFSDQITELLKLGHKYFWKIVNDIHEKKFHYNFEDLFLTNQYGNKYVYISFYDNDKLIHVKLDDKNVSFRGSNGCTLEELDVFKELFSDCFKVEDIKEIYDKNIEYEGIYQIRINNYYDDVKNPFIKIKHDNLLSAGTITTQDWHITHQMTFDEAQFYLK